MKYHTALPLLLLASIPLFGCGPDTGYGGDQLATEFCREALARVDAFTAETGNAPRSPMDAERDGGTAVVGVIGEIVNGMNGFVSGDHAASQHQLFVNLMTLIRYDADLKPVPWLAESWELSDDATELTFRLRDDVYWHDGVLTTAHDVAFTWRRVTDPETGFPNSAYWTHYIPGEAGVEVVDSFTVKFRLQPHAQILDPWRTLAIMPRHLLGDVPPSELRQHPFGSRCPVGNGPFRFVDHSQDDRWTFAANHAFPEGLGGRPHVDRYVYRVIPEMTTLLAELLTENIDLYIAPGPDQASSILSSEALRFIQFPFRSYIFVGWNSRRPQLADARVRRAITHATNRQEIIDAVLQGYGTIANAGVPPMHWGYDPTIENALPYDQDRARALLDEAGWIDRNGDGIRENEDGLRLEFSIKYNAGNQQRQDVAEIMQSQLRRVGIAVRPQVVEYATLFGQITSPSRDFDGFVITWVPELKVDDTNLFHSSNVDQTFGWAGMEDPELDRLLEALQKITDQEEALPLWHEYQRRIVELQPFTYFVFQERLAGVNRRLEGVEMDVRGEWVHVKEWWIPEARRRAGRTTAAQ